jgi:peptidoglycan-associated lipoprotein
MRQKILWIGILVVSLGVVGCASKDKRSTSNKYGNGFEAGDTRELLKDKMAPVFFNFDQSELRLDGRNILGRHASYMKNNKNVKIQIEGHCDERGTVEYNLALGEKRAMSVKDYLSSNGVDEARVNFVSYGEERPADPSSNEEAWAANRRAEFVLYK